MWAAASSRGISPRPMCSRYCGTVSPLLSFLFLPLFPFSIFIYFQLIYNIEPTNTAIEPHFPLKNTSRVVICLKSFLPRWIPKFREIRYLHFQRTSEIQTGFVDSELFYHLVDFTEIIIKNPNLSKLCVRRVGPSALHIHQLLWFLPLVLSQASFSHLLFNSFNRINLLLSQAIHRIA